MDKPCDWRVCVRDRQWRDILISYKIAGDDKDFLDSVHADLCHAEEERDYYYLILNGDWPSSVGQLQRALKDAKKKKKKEVRLQTVDVTSRESSGNDL
jgi:hypothetical protein